MCIAESTCIGRVVRVPGGANDQARVVDEAGLEVGVVSGRFGPSLAVSGRSVGVYFCRLRFRRFRGPHFVGVWDARSCLQWPDAELPFLYTVLVGCDSWMESFDVNGGAMVLLEHDSHQIVDYNSVDLNSDCNFWTVWDHGSRSVEGPWRESFDTNSAVGWRRGAGSRTPGS